jgi:DNA gyrase subunit B
MILEVLAYANDEAASTGRVGTAVVTTQADGSVSVADDGRGTDTRRDADGRVVRKPVMATRDVRFFDDPHRPVLPDGLPRWGMSVVAALSSLLVHENRRTTASWRQAYHHGIPAGDLLELLRTDADGSTGSTPSTGTTVTFRLDGCPREPESLTAADVAAFDALDVAVRHE